MKSLIIIGAGGHGRVIVDIAQKLDIYQSIAFLDDGEAKESMGLPILGKTSDMEKYVQTADMFVAIGNSKLRGEFIERLLALGACVPTLVHPSAVIGACVEIGAGTAVMAGAVINPCAKLGRGVILNTCSSIDHDCIIGDYCHISVGVHIAGGVTLGDYVLLRPGVVVEHNTNIESNKTLLAPSVFSKDENQCSTLK